MRIRTATGTITISDMPNILFGVDPLNGYHGYKGIYISAECPVCKDEFYYNRQYYPEAPPPTCGRYFCLREKFTNA